MAFQFKQFIIDDAESAMKVGTDSVLLGAWINYEGADSILDVGTGCGLLALMAAQNTNAVITALEIDEGAYNQALKNFVASKWSERLTGIFADFRVYSREINNQQKEEALLNETNSPDDGTFDLIISNPPFFSNSLKSGVTNRDNARHDCGLPYTDLIRNSKLLLSEKGRLNLIFPYTDYEQFDTMCKSEGLFLARKTMVTPRKGKQPNRVLLEYSNMSGIECKAGDITIRDEYGKYTSEYLSLTEPYYLFLR